MSDQWKAYDGISNVVGYNFKHYTGNHNENLDDPEISAHTQNIENL